jgi:hypothetical protein
VRANWLFLPPPGAILGFSRRVTPAAPFFGFGSRVKCGIPMTRSRIILPVLLLAAVLLTDGRAHHSVARSICGAVVGAGPRLAHRRVGGECALSTLGPNLIRTLQRTRNA